MANSLLVKTPPFTEPKGSLPCS